MGIYVSRREERSDCQPAAHYLLQISIHEEMINLYYNVVLICQIMLCTEYGLQFLFILILYTLCIPPLQKYALSSPRYFVFITDIFYINLFLCIYCCMYVQILQTLQNRKSLPKLFWLVHQTQTQINISPQLPALYRSVYASLNIPPGMRQYLG